MVGKGGSYDKNGADGVWDILDKAVGARNTPRENATPWTVFVRTGVLVVVHPDGRIKMSSTTARTSDIEFLEQTISTRMGDQWCSLTSHMEEAKARPVKITFGQMSNRASDRIEVPGFRKAHSSFNF